MWTGSRSRSAISSERSPLGGGTVVRAAAAALAFASACAPAEAKVLLTQTQALDLAFGGAARAERRTAYLTEPQADAIREKAGTPPPSRIVVYYEGTAEPVAHVTAWFDTHLVRTLPESIMVVLDPSGKVRRVDILSFDEPEDYLPKPRWLEQFSGRPLDEDLSTKRGIRSVSGATLSSRAITDAVRRVLATRSVVAAASAAAAPEGSKP